MCNFNLGACNSVLSEQITSRHRLKLTHRSVNKEIIKLFIAYLKIKSSAKI